MLHDNQGSFGPFGYCIAATDIAARADTAAPRYETIETEPAAITAAMVNAAVSALRTIAASIVAKPEAARTA